MDWNTERHLKPAVTISRACSFSAWPIRLTTFFADFLFALIQELASFRYSFVILVRYGTVGFREILFFPNIYYIYSLFLLLYRFVQTHPVLLQIQDVNIIKSNTLYLIDSLREILKFCLLIWNQLWLSVILRLPTLCLNNNNNNYNKTKKYPKFLYLLKWYLHNFPT